MAALILCFDSPTKLSGSGTAVGTTFLGGRTNRFARDLLVDSFPIIFLEGLFD